jgi:hypothetical protein
MKLSFLASIAFKAAAFRPYDNFGANEVNPAYGAANQPYIWNQVEPFDAIVDPKNQPDDRPSPRNISNTMSKSLVTKAEERLSILLPMY